MSGIRLNNVSFHYPQGFQLDCINLDIPHKSFLGLIGPNGSGKTTLLRLMSHSLEPTQGEILLGRVPLQNYSPRQLAQKVAVISSEQFFQFPFPVREVIAMGRTPFLERFQRMAPKQWHIVNEAMERTEILHLAERPISQLSSGERQRVFLARALCQKPAILILDEPSAHLDINHQINTFHLLQDLNREEGLTIIVVLHDLSAAAAFCEKIALLCRGKLVSHGSPKEVITQEMVQNTYGAKITVFPSPETGQPQIALK